MSRNPGFAERLAAQIGWKKKGEFARALGIQPVQLSRYLKGQVPDLKTLLKLAEATGKSVEWLVTGEEAQATHGVVTTFQPGSTVQSTMFRVLLDPDLTDIVASWERLGAEERKTIRRLIRGLKASPEVRTHLVGQLKLIDRLIEAEQPASAGETASPPARAKAS